MVAQASSQRPRRHARRKEARPGEILAAALSLFAEHGFAATRLEDVARRAGVSKGTIYLYFPTKEALFRAVIRQGLVPNIAAMEALAAAHDGSAVSLLAEIAARLLAITESDLAVIPRLVLTESGNFPNLARLYAEELAGRGRSLIASVIARGIERGEFRPIDIQTAVSLFAAPILLILLWRTTFARHGIVPLDPRALLETHLETFFRGLAPGAP
ncbi:MAG TPA: TetR family transcriptional regulator [Acetobacteraceae bacterium]|nr:TetR family transcriptional regulator [Acetobacteraceae bacterium]